MIVIREAYQADNEGLLRLTYLTPMEGRISLRIDRKPDFFNLLKKRGDSTVFIAEDKGKIVGCFSASQSDISINGNHEKVHYLADLKINPIYKGRTLTARLLRRMADYLLETGADILFCTAAYGNEKVKPILAGRGGFPKFEFTGTFRIFQIIPLIRKVNISSCVISAIDVNDEIVDLYNRFYKRYQYCPVFSRDIIRGVRTIAATEKNKVLASLTLENMVHSKQNILVGLPLVLKLILSLLKLINRITPIINLPVIGEPVSILYIRAFAFDEGREDAFEGLVRHAGNMAYMEKFHYLAVGIHERDFMAKYFTKYMHFTYNSLGFIMSMKGNNEKIKRILNGVLFEDYSLV